MDLTTLQEFRQEIYNSFERAGDSLFNTIDALISESQAQSFPELSLSAFFHGVGQVCIKPSKEDLSTEKDSKISLLSIFPHHLWKNG
jgi:hypothetical protein